MKAKSKRLAGLAARVSKRDPLVSMNTAMAYRRVGRFEEAVASYDQALEASPAFAEAWNNRGNALYLLGRHDLAVASYNKALHYRPNFADAYDNRGVVLLKMQRYQEALESFEQAVALQPDYAKGHFNLSLCLLQMGRLKEGWQLYDWRWARNQQVMQPFLTERPLWQLGDASTSVLIWHEQGVGDEIMFSGLLDEVQSQVQELWVQVDARLISLFQRSMPNIQFVDQHTVLDDGLYDAHLPMGSLPRFFRNTLNDFPLRNRYLQADPERAQRLRQVLRGSGKPVIGLSWQSTSPKYGLERSIDLSELTQALSSVDATFLSLQYGDVRHDLEAQFERNGVHVLACDFIDKRDDLDGLAALVDACDAVISVDNTTVHLAAALGKSVHVMLPLHSDWRWMVQTQHSPWYPTVKLYRQSEEGCWRNVLTQLVADLQATRASGH